MAESTTPAVFRRGALDEWINPLVVEAIGAFALIYMGAGSIIMTGGSNLVAVALAYGLAFGLMVLAAGHISGGLFNPALTIGLWAAGRLSTVKSVAYIIVQLVGALLAALLLKATFPGSMTGVVDLGVPAVGGGFTAGQALPAEIVATFFLMYAMFGNAVDPRGKGPVYGLGIGLIITMDVFAVGGVSGAAMNPARWFGPALVANAYGNWWVWWLGPIIGALVAALVYGYVHLPPRREETTASQ